MFDVQFEMAVPFEMAAIRLLICYIREGGRDIYFCTNVIYVGHTRNVPLFLNDFFYFLKAKGHFLGISNWTRRTKIFFEKKIVGLTKKKNH